MGRMGYELAMFFFIYSFLGWIVETVVKSLSEKKFVNRGFFNGPFCFIYGFAGVLMSIVFIDLKSQPVFFLFIGCAALATAIEWFTGKLLNGLISINGGIIPGRSGILTVIYVFNIRFWGLLGTLAVKYVNSFFIGIFDVLPVIVRGIIVWALAVIGILTVLHPFAAVFHIKKGLYAIYRWNSQLDRLSHRLGKWIVSHVEKRMVKAYPAISKKGDTK